MAVRITPTNASVAVASSKPRVSIQVVVPQTDVAYVLPVTAISYIVMTVGAELDVSGRYQFRQDAFAVVDTKTILVAKALADSQGVNDHIASKDFGKNRTDFANVSDVFERTIEFIREYADSTGVSDFAVFDALKVLADSVGETDSQTFDHNKLIPDGVAMNDQADTTDGFQFGFTQSTNNLVFASDLARRDVSKSLVDEEPILDALAIAFTRPLDMDMFSLSDLASLEPHLVKQNSITTDDAMVRDTTKGLFDTQALADLIAQSVAKALEDSQSLSDTSYRDVGKGLNSSITQTEQTAFDVSTLQTDSFLALESLAKDFSRPVTGDTTSSSDLVSLNPGLVKSHSVSMDDTGSLLSQGYCDLTYFAADYVGETRTFT